MLENKVVKIMLGFLFFSMFSGVAKAGDVFEASSKSGEYNEIILKQPFVDMLFNNKKAIDGKIVVLNNNKNIMFKVKPNVKKPLQLFIVLRDGTRKKIKVVPNPKIDGQTWPSESASVLSSQEKEMFTTHKSKEQYIEILKELYEAKVTQGGEKPAPAGFAEEVPSDVAYYGPVLIREIKRFSNTIYRISVYALSSEQVVPVTPADFYRDDVIAIELNADYVGGPGEQIMVVLSKEPME